MWTRQKRRTRLGWVVLPLVTVGVCAYFAHHALEGPNGWHARAERIVERDALALRLAELSAERKRMAERANLLNGTLIERDVLDERARDLLGVSREDEIIVVLRQP